MKRRQSSIALALTIALAAVAAGARAATPAPVRLELAPTPSPSPAANPLGRASVNQSRRGLDIKQIVGQHMTALGRLPRRTFTQARSSAGLPVRQDVVVGGRSWTAFTRAANYCAQHSPEIDRVSGDVTPAGVLTISGICFGTSGSVRITGQFSGTGVVVLLTESWTDSLVKVRVTGPSSISLNEGTTAALKGVLDQPVDLRLTTQRVAASMKVVSPNLVSAPVRLRFTAARETMEGTGYVGTSTCAGGETADGQRPDFCGDTHAWGHNCDLGDCMVGYHLRKAAASGEDVYSIAFHNGFVLENVVLLGDNAELSFDPSLDPSHVTFRIRWRTARAPNYNDGSYMFYPTIRGPWGVRPT